jgi:1,4-dihydroxy-2-naphthoate octaprenyltransferase
MIRFWWIAMRPASVVKVTLPILVGLSIGFARTQEIRPVYIAFALIFGWLDQLLIIFLNDYADAEADLHHASHYPQLIDSRVIPNRWLEKREVLTAGLVCASLMIAQAAVLAISFKRSWAPLLAATAIAFLWAYSFPPLKLNYRGFGELLESIGVGGVLPLAGFYFYTG